MKAFIYIVYLLAMFALNAVAQTNLVVRQVDLLKWEHPDPAVTNFIAAFSFTNKVAKMVPLNTVAVTGAKQVECGAIFGAAPSGTYALWVAARKGTNQSDWSTNLNVVWLPSPTGLQIIRQ